MGSIPFRDTVPVPCDYEAQASLTGFLLPSLTFTHPWVTTENLRPILLRCEGVCPWPPYAAAVPTSLPEVTTHICSRVCAFPNKRQATWQCPHHWFVSVGLRQPHSPLCSLSQEPGRWKSPLQPPALGAEQQCHPQSQMSSEEGARGDGTGGVSLPPNAALAMSAGQEITGGKLGQGSSWYTCHVWVLGATHTSHIITLDMGVHASRLSGQCAGPMGEEKLMEPRSSQ